MGSVTAPRSITTDAISLHPPVDDDSALVAELMDVPAGSERPAEIVRGWRDHWDEHGYGTWIISDASARGVGFVGLRAHSDFIRVTIRTLDGRGDDVAGAALRLVVAHALEWLPDLPLRLRVAPDDRTTRAVAEAAGMEHAPDLDHAAGGEQWVVLELPWARVADRIPQRARDAMLDMWVRVNDAGGAVGFVPGADEGEVAAVLDGYAERLDGTRAVCVALNSPGGDLLGFGFVVRPSGATVAHTATLERIMTDPERRGTNHGALLMSALHRAARELGVEVVTLDYRGGTGLGEFYTRYGYTEVGRVPGGVRVAPGEDRDGVIMARLL